MSDELESQTPRDTAPAETNVSPAKATRDNRGCRDRASRKDFLRVVEPGQSRGQSGSHPYFDLVEHADASRMAGVYWVGVVRKGGEVVGYASPRLICSPLRIAADTRDMQGGEWGRFLVFPDRDGREHRLCMPMRLLAGSGEELRSELLAAGLTITTNPRDRNRLAEYIQTAQPNGTARCVSRTGWHGNVFVLLHETFGDTEAEQVLFQSTSLDGVTLGQAGTFEGWREQVAAPCAGHSRLVLAICAGFAGPCLGLLGMEGGGFHLRGASSTGKSTALSVAASLFGPPSFLRTWRNTDNALEGVAALHSDLLLLLDEIGQLDPKHAGQVAYLLANGQGKARAARDGSPRPLTTWRVLFLSAGEMGLGDLLAQSGGKVRAGQEVRVIDLPAEAGVGRGVFETLPENLSPGALAEALKMASATHYGHALPTFLRVLVTDLARVREKLAAHRNAIAAELIGTNISGQVRRVAERFALVAAAGELATEYGLTGWVIGEGERAVKMCFQAWLAARGTEKDMEPARMLEQVRAFLSAHGESRFTKWGAQAEMSPTLNRAGFRKDGEAGPVFYVERETFKREICSGFDPASVAKALAEMGALKSGSSGEATRKERLPDGRSVRVYVITPALWGDA